MKKFINKIMVYGVLVGLLMEAVPVWALKKDESIYAKLEANGQVNQVIVSEHLEQTGDTETVDKTKLTDIENINGEEKYTLDNGKLVWESNGKDIYYQGSTKEELPVTLSIKYYLNGEETSIKDMLGKKGNIKIVLKYNNNDKHSVNVNGKYETLYTPFVIATTSIIPNTTNKNIKVTNGKAISNGTNTIVAAISTPGLYESLGLDKLKGMDTVEISYDTDSFELSSIYSLATPKLIDSADLEIFDNIDKLYSSINTLSNSSNQIKSGSSKLLQGASQLNDGVNKVKDGVEALYGGSKQIKDTVANSITALENDNSPALDNETITTIKETSKAIVLGTLTDEYLEGVGDTAVEKLAENAQYAQLKASVEQLAPLVEVCSKDEIPEAYQATCAAKQAEIAQYPSLVQLKTVMENTARETAIQTTKTAALETAELVSEKVAVKVANDAKKTAKTTTVTSLNQLLGGLTELTNGLYSLNIKMPDLTNGTEQLKDGILQLDNGIAQFNSQGINKIANIVNGDVKSIEGKVKALIKLSDNYKTFDEISEGTEGSTKIIMVVDGIKKASDVVIHNEKIDEEKKSLWDKIKGLFN